MIKILHLYYDLLNLYGEQGNILALKQAFKNQNIEVKIDYLTINDKIKPNDYDLIYLGSGSDDNLLIVLEDIKKYKKDLKKYIENKKHILATGNSFLLFGKTFNSKECLGIFNYYSKSSERISSEALFSTYSISNIIGFQNKTYLINNQKNHLFNVINGLPDNLKSTHEGYHEHNFYGTSLLGPLLIRNPHFTNSIIKEILEKNNLIYNEYNDELLLNAYNEYIKNFIK